MIYVHVCMAVCNPHLWQIFLVPACFSCDQFLVQREEASVDHHELVGEDHYADDQDEMTDCCKQSNYCNRTNIIQHHVLTTSESH